MEKRVFKSNFLKGAVCAALAVLLCAALLTCSNAAGGSDAPSSQQSVSSSSRKPGYVTLTGTVSVSGAVPQILADTPDASDNSQNGLSRSAYPGIDASGADATMEYFATATCGSDVVNGTFGSGREAKKFGIELAASKTWSVVVGVRSKTPDAEGNKKIYLQSKPWSVTPDPADPTISRNFVPVPIVTSAGKGTIELAVNYIHSVFDTSARFVSGPSGYDSLTIISSTDGNDQIYKVLNVPSGTYELCIDIMEIQGGNKFLVYSSIQTVSVADGMTTNAWVSDGSGIIDSNGTFKFDDSNATALKQSYLSSNIYVGKYSDESNSQIAAASDTNSGNWMAPLASINQAVNRINSAGKSNIDYVVHLNGKIQSDDLNNTTRITASTVTATHAKSITIVGTTGPSKDILEATKQGTPALMVTTSVPIIIKNIKLDGYSGAGSSAALDASGGAKVTIESGVEIADADLGVRVADTGSDGTTVTMKGGTISGNVTAVDLQGGDFILQGGSIPYDTSISSTKKNDVKLASGKVIKVHGDLTAVTGDKIGVTPSERKRGVKVVDTSATTANAATVEGKFLIADPTITSTNPLGDEWQVVAAAAEHALKTNAPIYVGQDPNGYAGSNDNPGTKSAPYYEIKRACKDMDDAGIDYEINVRGTVSGAQTIPNTLSKDSTTIFNHAKSVTIKGVTALADGVPQDAIDAGSAGTALTVASSVPITIQNLKITKGGGSSVTNGGGISMSSVTDVTISSGALITANKAKNHGGGIYCEGGKLYIKNGAKICANEISGSSGNRGGIGIYATGSSVIEMTGGEISGNKDTSHVDVVGGGVKLEGSASFKMSGGEVKDNQVVRAGGNFYVTGGDSGPSVTLSGSAKITGGVADSSSFSSQDAIGGAVWLEGAGSRLDMSGGEISGNKAKSSSGKNACAGIYVSGATFTMTGGKISGNNVLGGNSQGGAVRLNGKFNISGSAYIPYGGAVGNNDVFLCDGKTVTIAGTLIPPEGVTKVAAITPSVFKRGTNILDSGTPSLLTLHKEKFSVSQDDADWNKVGENIAGQFFVRINSPVYVVGAEGTGSTKPDGFGWGQTTGATGTKGHPFASVSAALSVLETGAIEEITIAGLLKGAQAISGTFPSFTLKGYGDSSSAVINAGGASGAGSALTVNASGKTVTIQDLTITGGNATNGGGINIAAGTVNLESGAIVSSNKVTDGGFGAGVYVDASTTLNIKEGAEIYNNTAYSGSIDGGGVYNKGTVNISGGKLYKNTANNGGAIYNAGTLAISGGTIGGGANDKNSAAVGGAIYNAASKSFTLSGGYLTYNYATSSDSAGEVKGGGVYNAGTLTVSGSASISYNTASQTNTSKGYASGGGIYNETTGSVTVSDALTMDGNAATVSAAMSGYSKSSGGAIYNAGILTMSNGTIGSSSYPNKALGNTVTVKQGGAIYQGGTFKISGSAVVTAGTEKENDVYLPLGKTVTVASVTLSGGDSVAAVTPANWNRGTNIIDWGVSPSVAQKTTIKGQIQLSKDNAGWDREEKASGGKNYVCITSPIYVAGASGTGSTLPSGFNNGKTIANGANGTKTSPYASIADALTASDLDKATEPNTITVAGTLVGAQQEISSPSVDIKLKGYTSDAKIQRWSSKKTSSQDAGSVLIVNASGKTVTITDLTLSYGASSNGGGIYITNGTVKLGDYAKISENYAGNKGGGVYVSSGATLFMYGKALIGDKLSTDTGITTATGQNYGNAAPYQGGGGIYNEGSVYIGYNGFKADGTTLQESAIDAGYGIIRCYTMNQDGGAIYNNGTLKIKSGSISYNRTANSGGAVVCVADATISGGTFESNYAGVSGGAVSIKASKTLTINGDAIFKNNQAESGGGAISNWGTLTMTAGTIGESGALNRIAEGKTGSGGAISQNGTFNISGSAQVYSGTGVGEKQNDVYLASGKTVTAGVFETGGNSSSIPMVITPYSWTRGSTAVTAATGVTLDATKLKCFKMSDEDWSVVLHSSAGKINAPVYVASDTSTAGFKVCTGLGSDSDGNGSRAKPYKTIAKALSKAWDTSTTKTIPLVIKIDGTVKGNQTIAGNINAQYVAINGCYSSTDFTDCVLDGNASGTVLTITTATPVCLDYKLKITNGSNADGNGGGVSISGTSSTVVVRGVRIQGNTAKNGGGLYVGPGCKAICNNYGYIGAYPEDINNKAPESSTPLSKGINKATQYGGGIYNEGTLYLGYSYNYSNGAIEDPWDDDPFYVKGNYATDSGGGVYTIGSMSMTEDYTSISYNRSSHGGGVCVATTGDDKAFFDSGIIESNSVGGYGGGIFIKTGAKAEIEADSTRPFIVRNNSGQTGGGLNIGGNLKATGSYFYVYGNSATTVGGGGAYVNGVFDFREGVIGRDEDGNVKSNTKTTGKGSGVYVASSASQFIMAKEGFVDVNNDIYLPINARIYVYHHSTNFKSDPPPGIITRPSYTTDTEIFAMGPDFGDTGFSLGVGLEKFKLSNSQYEIKLVSGTWCIKEK